MPLGAVPVLLARMRSIAVMRSSGVRKPAVAGELGITRKIQRPKRMVMGPCERCQGRVSRSSSTPSDEGEDATHEQVEDELRKGLEGLRASATSSLRCEAGFYKTHLPLLDQGTVELVHTVRDEAACEHKTCERGQLVSVTRKASGDEGRTNDLSGADRAVPEAGPGRLLLPEQRSEVRSEERWQ